MTSETFSTTVKPETPPGSERAPAPSETVLITIEPTKSWVSLRLGDLWQYRELLYFLTWRDVKVRYKQTLLGAAWAILQPLLTMLIFTLLFGRLAGIKSEGVPYPIFAYGGLLIWTFFANSVNNVGGHHDSVVGSPDNDAGRGSRNVALGAECKVPRYSLCHSVLDPTLDVCVADHLPIEYVTGKVAMGSDTESSHRHNSEFPRRAVWEPEL